MAALYRPGPMEHIPTFIAAKHGRQPIRYPHPTLASILEETYGVIVYQDQVLFIVQAFAGYSLGQADIFRKAMGKKIPEVMKKERRNFIAGAKNRGFSTEVAESVFALIEPFAGYAFNKAHAFSYALIAYQTAYLKANYPAEYITAFLITNAGQLEKAASAVAECRRLDITVLQPDIQHSQANFSIEQKGDHVSAIRFGLTAIKNVGSGAVEPIIAERDKGGKFKSIEDFCRRCDLRGLNKRTMESLIKAGAFDSLGDRGTLLHNINSILSLAQREQRLRETGQSTMFDLWGQTTALPMPSLDMEPAGVTDRERASWEKELIGVPFSRKLFDPSKQNPGVTLCGTIDAEMNGKNVTVAGELASVTQLMTRKDSRWFVKVTVEDISGSVEATVWPRVYEENQELWQEGNLLQLEATVRIRDDSVQLNVNKADLYPLPAVPAEEVVTTPPQEVPPIVVEETPPETLPVKNHRLVISMIQTSDRKSDIARLGKLISSLKDFPGKDEVTLYIKNEDSIEPLRLPTTGYCPELHQRLAELVGEEGLKVETIVS
jgi:DNA polymerase-3 subunit alpha